MNQINGGLTLLPCLDSPEMAAARRRELWIPRERAAELGVSALDAAREGRYRTPAGKEVSWGELVEAACAAKRSLPPGAPLLARHDRLFETTEVQVSNETTLGAARRLYERGLRTLALNFANGLCPGGGFLPGARAQEEVLCRSSALYLTLVGDPMYEAHRARALPDSSEWAIYSPDVPVFRADDGTELDHPWALSFITCAAPYAPEVGQPQSGHLLRRRILRVLDIARAFGYTTLVLGAWGCGAFANDPKRTAADFRDALEHEFRGAFSHVLFAIVDWSHERETLGPFRNTFGEPGT